MSQGTDPGQRIQQVLAAAWQGAGLHEALQVIVEGASRVAGFGVAALSVRHDTDEFEMVAVAGGDEDISDLVGAFTPMASIQLELDAAEDWGPLKFVPHERLPEGIPLTWVPDIQPVADDPDAWHPLDLLIAPLLDVRGDWVGMLSVDLPVSGHRPGPEQRRILEMYVEQASRALGRALERARLAERVRLAEVARTIVRKPGVSADTDAILAECEPLVLEAFRAQGMWLQLLEDRDGRGGRDTVTSVNGAPMEVPAHLVALAERAALACWRDQRVAVVSRRRTSAGLFDDEEQEQIMAFLESVGTASLLFVPIGVGMECLGNLVLTRTERDVEWGDVEARWALDIGHDIGGMLLNARNIEHQRQLVTQLRELDTYKSRLIATISHEFKNPLTSILGHLEMLEDLLKPEDPTRTSADAIQRGALRLSALVEQLLDLSRVSDPDAEVETTPVDLSTCVRETVDLLAVQAGRKEQQVRSSLPDEPAWVLGSRDDLDIVCTNLLSNAVKYTGVGGRVGVEVTVEVDKSGRDVVVLRVEDEGIGIAAEDRAHLFEEFYRSADPEAHRQPGSGLGLAIVARVVARHGGTIEVDSELGRGSSFAVTLPGAPGV